MRPQFAIGSAVTTITKTITAAAGVFAPGHLGELTQIVPFDLADAVLAETGAVQRRLRALPSRVGLYFVLALCLFPATGYRGVWAKLAAGLDVWCPDLKALRDLRRRIGAAPVKALFEVLAGPVAWPRTPGVMFGRYRTVAFDGCRSIKVPDTGRNRSWLGKLNASQGETGYPVIQARLGHRVAASTVWEILHAAGVDPAPRRSGPTWRQFLSAQAHAVVACDFFTVDTVMLKRIYVLVFIEHGTRLLHVAGVTANPTGAWVTQQARNLAMDLGERMDSLRFLVRDRDAKFIAAFDEVFRAGGVRILRTPPQAPQANAICERVVGTLRREVFDQMLIFNEKHLAKILAEYADHYNQHRPHQSRGQRPPTVETTATADHRPRRRDLVKVKAGQLEHWSLPDHARLDHRNRPVAALEALQGQRIWVGATGGPPGLHSGV